MALQKREFMLAEHTVYVGYYNESTPTWNGWDVPFFDYETAVKIYEQSTMGQTQGYAYKFDSTNKKFLATMENGEEIFDECEMQLIDGMELYEVGGCNFCWSLIEED